MVYLYIVMLLQEMGKEINAANIKKILNDLDIEEDDAKVRFVVSALSVLMSSSRDEISNTSEKSTFQKLTKLQNRFDTLESSMTRLYELLVNTKSEHSPVCQICHKEEKGEDIVQSANARKLDSQPEITKQGMDSHDQPARYVYGIGGKGIRKNLGAIGLDGADVYTIPYKELCMVVHDCLAEPYKSEDENAVKEWLFTQQEVLDIAVEKFEGVLPMSFDMIIEGKNGNDPETEAVSWLKNNYDSFMETMIKIRNRQEFGIQVILDTKNLSEKLFQIDEKLREKKDEIDTKPEGIAYMEREILKELVKERIEEKADQYFKEFYHMIKKYVDDIVIGKVKKVGGNQQMLMNLSCLVKKENVALLGNELEKIKKDDSITVRFSGPWAPYSFVTPEKGVTSNNNG